MGLYVVNVECPIIRSISHTLASIRGQKVLPKNKTFVDDFASFLSVIKTNPYQGVDLGGGKRKIRMAVAARGKGKSGGLRVITRQKYYKF